jgi:hippurate hydrolase
MKDATFFHTNHAGWTSWRQDFHMHPELAYQEHRTSALVAERLKSFGVDVHTGYAGTGVVGVLKTGDGPNIGLRADMDALPILEQTQKPYQSTKQGVMHACGHDGHTTMLLAAAQYLAETKAFKGTATFIFQPAEEGAAGAAKMIKDGLFTNHNVDEVFALHNWPGLAQGTFSGRVGPQMAGFDTFEITVTGVGGHAAMPHDCRDGIVAAGHLITALQSVVSRSLDPQAPAVLSVTQIHGGDALNVIPEVVTLAGCTRYFDKKAQADLKLRLLQICAGIETQFGVRVTVDYKDVYPPTINHATSVDTALRVASTIAGPEHVYDDQNPSMASEDFAFMLERVPGAYLWLGNGPVQDFGALHSPQFDFNDAIIPTGAAFLARLVEHSCAET